MKYHDVKGNTFCYLLAFYDLLRAQGQRMNQGCAVVNFPGRVTHRILWCPLDKFWPTWLTPDWVDGCSAKVILISSACRWNPRPEWQPSAFFSRQTTERKAYLLYVIGQCLQRKLISQICLITGTILFLFSYTYLRQISKVQIHIQPVSQHTTMPDPKISTCSRICFGVLG